jgi:hypothetical protein
MMVRLVGSWAFLLTLIRERERERERERDVRH